MTIKWWQTLTYDGFNTFTICSVLELKTIPEYHPLKLGGSDVQGARRCEKEPPGASMVEVQGNHWRSRRQKGMYEESTDNADEWMVNYFVLGSIICRLACSREFMWHVRCTLHWLFGIYNLFHFMFLYIIFMQVNVHTRCDGPNG